MKTAPLKNGDPLPTHPAHTTALTISHYNGVFDATDGKQLAAGLHRQEIYLLRAGNKAGLNHLYRYAIESGHIYHTRNAVEIAVECDHETESEPARQ